MSATETISWHSSCIPALPSISMITLKKKKEVAWEMNMCGLEEYETFIADSGGQCRVSEI